MAWHSCITKYFSPYGEWGKKRRNWRYLGQRIKRTDVAPNSQNLVFALNDTTLEVGRGSPAEFKGLLGLGFGMLIPLCGFGMFYGVKAWSTSTTSFDTGDILFTLFYMLVLFLLFLLGCLSFFGDFFGYTAAPVRFDRKRRKVWAFVSNSRSMAFDWDSLKVVTQQIGGVSKEHNMCNLLFVDEDDEGKVKWERGLARVIGLGSVQSTSDDAVAIYEFVRRFMEEGPQALPRCEHYLEHRPVPRDLVRSFGLLNFIHTWPETPASQKSWTTMAFVVLLGVLFSWIILPFDIASFVARWTSRIPRWQAPIEAAAAEGGPMRRPPGATSTKRYMRPYEWPFVILWVGSAFAIYGWALSLAFY